MNYYLNVLKVVVYRDGRVFNGASDVQSVVCQYPASRLSVLLCGRLSAGRRPATLCCGVIALADVEVFHSTAVLYSVWQSH